MSAKAEVLYGEDLGSRLQEVAAPPAPTSREATGWNKEQFAQEQLLSLVRSLFLNGPATCSKQVVFSAVDGQVDAAPICEQIAHTLYAETPSQIALVEWEARGNNRPCLYSQSSASAPLKFRGAQLAENLWKVARSNFGEEDVSIATQRVSWLADLRKQFEFAVISGPPAGSSSDAGWLGRHTDGLVLILAAHTTRKATAKQVMQTLQASQCRILGTVLCDRTFPIPQQIYCRL